MKDLGIVTVVNLRAFHSDRDELDPDLGYEHIRHEDLAPGTGGCGPRSCAIVTDPNRTPVLLHCKHGADRTGR